MIKAIDFFCGAGGLTRGLLNAGIAVLAGVDNDERLRETYAYNNEPSRFIGSDINVIQIHELREELGIQPGDSILYAACTPCQPFSTLNKLQGKDKRKILLLVFAQIVEKCPPDFILVENVPGLNNAYGKEIYKGFLKVLRRCGFSEAADLLDAKHFGVPQTRKRFILVASRHGSISLPIPETNANRIATVRQCIEKYPVIADGEVPKGYPNHAARKLQPNHKRIVAAIPKNGGSRRDVADTSILLKCHQRKPNVHKDVFGRMAWDEPSPTLTCRCTDVYCGRFIHPMQDRGISLREAAALQTFGDDYEFFGPSFLFLSSQIGNAVPVKLAEQLGKSIMDSC
ncbi:MAG: DNA cytosine methyltransferase [Ignavibacteria bacterium]|nr:DNA cytosine methyltransferase [Ignavibacteria bacterium]